MVRTPQATNLIAEALKANIEALKDLTSQTSKLCEEVKLLKASAVTKGKLKDDVSAIELQTTSIKKMKDDMVT